MGASIDCRIPSNDLHDANCTEPKIVLSELKKSVKTIFEYVSKICTPQDAFDLYCLICLKIFYPLIK